MVVLLLVSALAACGESDRVDRRSAAAPESLPKIGHCYGNEVQDHGGYVPDLTQRVACSERHLFEVTGVMKIPARLLRRAHATNASGVRELLGGEDFPPFSNWMDRTCAQANVEESGLGDLTIRGRWAADVLVEPVVSSAYTEWSVATEKQWNDGHRLAYCVLRFDESEDSEDVRKDGVRSPNSEALFQQFLDFDLPARYRYCWTLDEYEDTNRVSCSKPHRSESVFSYNVDEVFGKKFANRLDVDDGITDAQYEKLQGPCIEALPRVMGPIDSDLLADVVYGGWRWDEGHHLATCAIGTYDGETIPGHSLFGHAKEVHLLPESKDSGV